MEAAQAGLRQALRAASIDLEYTKEYRALIAKGAALFKAFIEGAIGKRKRVKLDFEVDFIVVLITGFAQRTTDERTSAANLVRQADLLTDMLIAHFKIA